MMTVDAHKSFELRGRDTQDLIDRLARFRHALHARHGAILHIRWNNGSPARWPCASIAYRIPLTLAELQASAA